MNEEEEPGRPPKNEGEEGFRFKEKNEEEMTNRGYGFFQNLKEVSLSQFHRKWKRKEERVRKKEKDRRRKEKDRKEG